MFTGFSHEKWKQKVKSSGRPERENDQIPHTDFVHMGNHRPSSLFVLFVVAPPKETTFSSDFQRLRGGGVVVSSEVKKPPIRHSISFEAIPGLCFCQEDRGGQPGVVLVIHDHA